MPSSPKPAVLVTGASGFVGRHLCAYLEGLGHRVHRVQRSGDRAALLSWRVADLAVDDIPSGAFEGVQTVIHLAACMPGEVDNGRTALMAERVVRSACAHGVTRIVVLSSVAARIAEASPSQARAYGVHKRAAERAALNALSSDAQCLILRPPVIYGAGARGSFGALLGLVRRAPALPLKNADAPRSYLSAANLCALIAHLIGASEATWRAQSGGAFEPHDGAGVTTRDLAAMMAQRLNRPARMFSLPKGLIALLGRITGKSDQTEAIFAPLICEDIAALERAFGWHPHEHMPQSLTFLSPSDS